jgi:two-component system repressor protein LuxO
VEVREGRFREDLYYRLHVVPVRMPPLRERNDDVLMIAQHFLRHFSDKEDKDFEGFAPAAEQAIRRYPWPGNVRQLQNAMHQLVVLNNGPLVETHMLPDPITSGHIETGMEYSAGMRESSLNRPSNQDMVAPHVARRRRVEPLWLTEKAAIEAAIEACDGNVNQAAGLLEVAPSTIYRKLQNWKKARA